MWIYMSFPRALFWTNLALAIPVHRPAPLFVFIICVCAFEMASSHFYRTISTLGYVMWSHKLLVLYPFLLLSELAARIKLFLSCYDHLNVCMNSCIVVNKCLWKFLSLERGIFNDLSCTEHFPRVFHLNSWFKPLLVHEISQVIKICNSVSPVCSLELLLFCLEGFKSVIQRIVVKSELFIRLDIDTNLLQGTDCWRTFIWRKCEYTTQAGYEILRI